MPHVDHSTPQLRVHRFYDEDSAAQSLAIRVATVGEDSVGLHWSPPATLANGHGILHGGMVFTLADTAFAYAWAAAGWRAVTRAADIAFLAAAHTGQTLQAHASIRSIVGRSGICDVQVEDEHGTICAEFRGTRSS